MEFSMPVSLLPGHWRITSMPSVPQPDPASTMLLYPGIRFTSTATAERTDFDVGIGDIPFLQLTSTIDTMDNKAAKAMNQAMT